MAYATMWRCGGVCSNVEHGVGWHGEYAWEHGVERSLPDREWFVSARMAILQ